MNRFHTAAMSLLILLASAPAMMAQEPLATLPTGGTASAIAFNGQTNKIYVVDGLGNSLTEIDGPTFKSTTIPLQSTGSQVATAQVAVNPILNAIYVINVVNNHIAVVDGLTHAVSFVP